MARTLNIMKGENMRYMTPRITSVLNTASVVLGGKIPGNFDGIEGMTNASAYTASE